MKARAPTSQPTIVNVGFRSTNYWVISVGTARLLVDLGWPGTMDLLRANLQRMDVPLSQLRLGLATHYHIDHAGLAQELKQAGVPLLVPDVQAEWIPRMKEHVKPADRFTDITLHDNRVITLHESREVLRDLGIDGEIVHTPGHSPDSVSLLLDGGAVFTGDLTHPAFMTEEQTDEILASWQRLRERGATTVHAGHGPVYPMPR
ncbi:MAG TPA: MBL fold metallo-hydrolase [Gemmatimonadaceae bacterium]|nr:MBL fold metallo-hydrolase [Gemmatimonadaceae bacterium]